MTQMKDILDGIQNKIGYDMTKVKARMKEEENKPLVAAVFGQTGTGKSSLTNALFGTKFKVDNTRPCTKEPQKHEEKSADGKKVIFWDLPGLGESDTADSKYIEQYIHIAKSCDIILWVFQADTRSILIDKLAIKKITDNLTEEDLISFCSKINVILTKADTVTADPWIFAKENDKLIIASGKKTDEILAEKALYFYDELLNDYADVIVHRINLTSECKTEVKFSPKLRLDVQSQKIIQKGKITTTEWKSIIKNNPRYEKELSELQKSQRGIVCSVRYNYNLN